ncbi:MAG: hypothetical protein QNJ04_04540 [Desulfobacterales bacterium]|nr:hypothetical protein [Desulfobacterales bacterium]
MILFDGEYSWEGRVDRQTRPISWWASTYHLKIVALEGPTHGISYLRPFIVSMQDTGQGASVVNCLPELAKHICAEFGLDLHRVLWVEQMDDAEAGIQVACFEPVANVAGEALYTTNRRPATSAEVDLIRAQLA